MSRLGRDYLKVGYYYTEIAFPEAEVRFIAINNGVDSTNQQDSDFTPFLNIINEWYAEIIRTFIEKVYVYGNEKPWNRNTKKIKVVFNFIGEVHIPTNVKTA